MRESCEHNALRIELRQARADASRARAEAEALRTNLESARIEIRSLRSAHEIAVRSGTWGRRPPDPEPMPATVEHNFNGFGQLVRRGD